MGTPVNYPKDIYYSSGSNTLAEADAVAVSKGAVLGVDQNWVLAAGLTLSAKGVAYCGGTISSSGVVTVLVNGKLSGDGPLFDVSNGLVLHCGKSQKLDGTLLGIVANDTADDTLAYKAAQAAVLSMPNGGKLELPAGVIKLTAATPVAGPAMGATTFGYKIQGQGKGNTILKYYGAIGANCHQIGAASTYGASYGVEVEDLSFQPDAGCTFTNGFNFDFCVAGLLNKCLFVNGAGVQCYIGRAQEFVVDKSEFRGAGSLYDGVGGLWLGNASDGQAGQASRISNSYIRGFYNTTQTGIGLWFAAGSEHSISDSILETGDFMCVVDTDSTKIINCSWETSVTTQGMITIGLNSTVSGYVIRDNSMSMSSVSGRIGINVVNYRAGVITGNEFSFVAGVNVYYGSGNTNHYSYFTLNNGIDAQVNVSYGGTNGKFVVFYNDNASVTPYRVAIGDGVTTPNVTNAETVVTANTGATSITQFLGAYPGKNFTLLCGDTHTTLVNSSQLVLPSGVNLSLTNGKHYMFRADQGSGATTQPIIYLVGGSP